MRECNKKEPYGISALDTTIKSVMVIEVIKITSVTGNGTSEDSTRIVENFYTKTGKHIGCQLVESTNSTPVTLKGVNKDVEN